MISFLSWISVTVLSLAVVYFFHILAEKRKRLPPSPRGIPILGHLHLLGKTPHRDLHGLAKKHGPIMYMRFGLVRNIIVSSPQAAEQFLKTNDHVFASRPPLEIAKYIAYEQTNLVFVQYGPYWRNMRKLCILQLLSNVKINSFQPIRREELGLSVESIIQAAQRHVSVDLSAKISSLTAEMSCRMVFSGKYEDKDITEKGFKHVIHEAMELGITPNLGEFFPFLQRLDLQGLTKCMKAVSRDIDQFLGNIIDEHVRDGNEERTKDIVDTLMAIMESGKTNFQFDRRHVKAIIMDMFTASAETTATTAEWTLSELIKHPQVMKKVQKELEQVVGLDRMVEESDIDGLEYLNMAVKETLRLHPPLPLLLPHYSMEDCTIDGYHIPKESRIIVNAYAIGRDPNAWDDPDKFIPERFVGSNVDLRGQHFQLLPFGSGRRSCPGIQLGLLEARLIVAQLVHCFDWQLPDNMSPQELDMTEEFGIVASRAKKLMAVPTYRLHVQ